MRSKDRIGQIYGWLKVLDIETEGKRYFAVCECKCGTVCRKRLDHLSCGKGVACSARCTRKHNNSFLMMSDNPAWKGCGELSSSFFKEIERNAVRRNIEFSLSIEEAWRVFEEQEGRCALSGVDLSFGSNHRSYDRTASLDRINSESPYTLDNVQWVHKEINIMKGTLSDDYFIGWCKLVAQEQNSLRS